MAWVLKECGLRFETGPDWKGRDLVSTLERVSNPEPGDIAVMGYDLPHYSIVESVSPKVVTTIDGRDYNQVVTRCVRKHGSQSYFSIDSLIYNYEWTGHNPTLGEHT